MEKLLEQKAPDNKIIAMDLETQEINGILTPVCVSVFDGKIK
jgi:hypothetical protein